MSYSTNYAFVYSDDRRTVLDAETFFETVEDRQGYEVAAVLEKYKDGDLVSRDQVIPAAMWVDVMLPDAEQKAIQVRGGNA